MPIDFLNMLSAFEQLDNQKEQLMLQRQEQASRNVAQAVGTLVTIAPEARAGYLQQMQEATGMNYSFLESLAANTPTPQSILVARGFERAMAAGDVSDSSLAAHALNMTPIAFKTQQQVSKFLDDGTVPDMIKRLDPKLQPQALYNLITSSAGLPDTAQLDLLANPLQTRAEQRNASLIGTDQRLGEKQKFGERNENNRTASRNAVGYAGIASNERQDTANRQLRNDQGLMQNSTQLYVSELGARVNMSEASARAKNGTGGGSGSSHSTANGMVDPVTGKSLSDLMEMRQSSIQTGIKAQAARNNWTGMGQNEGDKMYQTDNGSQEQMINEAIGRITNGLMTPPPAPTMATPAFTPTGGNLFGRGLGPAGIINSVPNR